MAKYCGIIGFSSTLEKDGNPGVYIPEIVEKKYFGDILEDNRRWEQKDKINDDLNITNRISVIADLFMTANMGAMKYATFMGTKWNIRSVSIAYPRVILSLGGLYNG